MRELASSLTGASLVPVPGCTPGTYSANAPPSNGVPTRREITLVPNRDRRRQRWRYSRSSPREMMVFWISDVPSPISRNGASRISRSISYSFE